MSIGPIVRRLLLATFTFALIHAPTASAQDNTDLWWNPVESGWGVNVVQSDNFLFLTFFIYGPDRKPTWYTGQLTWNGTAYSGSLYLTGGSWYAATWDPADAPPVQTVGTVTFEPSRQNAYEATLTYTVAGVGTVIKQVQRQSLTTIALQGNYVGGQSGVYSSCYNAADNGAYTDTYTLAVAETAARTATLSFKYDIGASCTLTGTLQQNGQLHRIAPASYQCTGSLTFNTQATVYELKQTSQGIEGRFSASLPSGCQESAVFSAALR